MQTGKKLQKKKLPLGQGKDSKHVIEGKLIDIQIIFNGAPVNCVY